jgi:hypothetical protein
MLYQCCFYPNRDFLENFFGRNFLGGIFWEEFFEEIFWENFFGRIFLGGILCLHCHLNMNRIDLFVKILSQWRRKDKKFRSLEVRRRLIALKNGLISRIGGGGLIMLVCYENFCFNIQDFKRFLFQILNLLPVKTILQAEFCY